MDPIPESDPVPQPTHNTDKIASIAKDNDCNFSGSILFKFYLMIFRLFWLTHMTSETGMGYQIFPMTFVG
jgi:hypothetical protein